MDKLYSCHEDAERLSHSDPDEAIEEYLDGCYPDPLLEKVTVYEHTRIKLADGEPGAEMILERVLEALDGEYGNPDEFSEPTPGMIAAAQELCRVIREEYTVWTCEQTSKEEVDVATWVKENRPDWLEEKA